jgi:hypothetical protein
MAMWEGVDYLFIDEVSMISCQFVCRMSEALCDAKGNTKPFGNINIIFVGDFAQLSPVGDNQLLSHINMARSSKSISMRDQAAIFGKLLWLSITTVISLTKNMRQHGKENWDFVNLLNHL